jgi:hypothetical protein
MDEQKLIAEDGRKWEPNALQKAIAKLLANPADRRSKKEKYESLNLPERTFYNWMALPEFREYVNSLIDQYTDGELPEVWRAHMLQIKRGNMQAIELFYKMKGLHPDVKLKKEALEKGEGVFHELLTAIAEAANGS